VQHIAILVKLEGFFVSYFTILSKIVKEKPGIRFEELASAFDNNADMLTPFLKVMIVYVFII
jgi:hypothetical protein